MNKQTNSSIERSRNIPQLRFPEFTGEWEKKKLGEVAELTSSKRVYANDYVANGIPFYRGKEITELKENKTPSDILYISNNAYEEFKKTFGVPQINDLLITAVGTLGNVLTIKNDTPFYFKDGNLIWLRKVNQNSEFLEIVLYFNFKIIEKSAIGSSQKALTMVELRKLIFSFPSLPEQTKIANFLTAVDEKIQALKKKHSLLAQYKKGVMQKLFSQELRFKDENGNDFSEWEVKKLGEVGETYGGLSGKSKENFGAGKPYIQYKQIFDDSKIDVSRFELVEIKEDENQNKVQFGDVFFTVSSETPNEIGMSSVLLEEIEELYLNSFCFGFRANSLEALSPYFSRYLFRSEIFRNDIIKLAQGSTRYNMSKLQLLKIEIQLPCLPEQTRIANFLSAIDEKITHTATQIEKMEVWKKGLLQKMFV